MSINLAPLMDGLVALAAAVVSAAAPVVVMWLSNYFKLNLDAQNRAALTAALENAVGTALTVGQTAADPKLSNVTIRNAALEAGVRYVLGAVPAAVAHFQLSDNDIAVKIAAKLALLLHVSGTADGTPPAAGAITTAAMLDRLVEAQDAPQVALVPPAPPLA